VTICQGKTSYPHPRWLTNLLIIPVHKDLSSRLETLLPLNNTSEPWQIISNKQSDKWTNLYKLSPTDRQTNKFTNQRSWSYTNIQINSHTCTHHRNSAARSRRACIPWDPSECVEQPAGQGRGREYPARGWTVCRHLQYVTCSASVDQLIKKLGSQSKNSRKYSYYFLCFVVTIVLPYM
jgi:hypothetical protein